MTKIDVPTNLSPNVIESYENLDHRTGEDRKKRFVTVLRAEKYWIEKARLNPAFYIHYVSEQPPAKHHLMWLSNIFDFTDPKKRRLNFIAPRESAKSTIAIYALCWYIARFPLSTNLIMSVSAKQAQARIEMLRNIILHNPRFKNVFPWVTVDERQRNTIQEFTVYGKALYDAKKNAINPVSYNVWRSFVTRYGSLKDPTIYSSGIGGKGVIGRRISGIMILDDIIDENYLQQELQDDVFRYIMRTLIPCLQENAKAINIGTRWMPDDVPEKLKNNPEWTTMEIQSLRQDEEGRLASYWDSFWPVEKLLAKKREIDDDALFNLMYQNDPRALVDAKFTLPGVSKPLPNPLPPMQSIFIGTDFAISLEQRADFTVFAAVGMDYDRNLYVLEIERMKATPDVVLGQLGAFVERIAVKYDKVTRVLIEKVAYQTSIKFSIIDKFPNIPVDAVPLIGNKGHRADLLATKCNNGGVYFNLKAAAYPQFRAEALNFQSHRHDDCVDAVALVLQYLGKSVLSTQVKKIKSVHLL